MSLPKGYKRLEYIQSSGTQYLDTLFKPNNNTRVTADFEITESTVDWACVFGAREESLSRCFALFTNSNQPFYCNIGGRTDTHTFTTISPLGRHVADANKNAITINGISAVLTARTFQNTATTIYLCANNEDGAASMFCKMRIYSCQIYENGTLVRDYIPCQNTSGAVGLWDAANEVFYGNAGTGTFTAGPVVPEAVDESEITELEYIESSGTQAINTGFIPNSNMRVTADFELAEDTGAFQYLFSGRTSHTAGDQYALVFTTGSVWRTDFYTSRLEYDTSVVGVGRHTADKNKNVCVLDGVTITNTSATFAGTYALHLFANNNAGVIQEFGNYRLYSCQIYDNGLLERDFVPAMLSHGEVGLYDQVFHEFYRNAGTGEFIAGPEVQTVPKAPANFRVESESDTLVTLAWDASEDAVGYRLYRQGQLLADITETSVSVEVEPFAGAVFTTTAYNENGEGAGTSLTYFKAPDDPILFLVTDRTQRDVTERTQKGYYAASDLNRVGYAVKYLAGRLRSSGVSVTVSPVLTWTDADWATPTTMKGYLADVQTMRGALKLASTTPEVPEDMERLTYTEANEIEAILLALDTHIKQMLMTVDAGWAMGLAYTGFYAKEAY